MALNAPSAIPTIFFPEKNTAKATMTTVINKAAKNKTSTLEFIYHLSVLVQ